MVFVGLAFPDSGCEIGEVDGDALQSSSVVRPAELLARRVENPVEMPPVRAFQLSRGRLGQLVDSIFLDCGQHRITAAVEDLLARQQAAFVKRDEKLARIRHAADRRDIFGKESAGKDGEPRKEVSRVLGEQAERVVETGFHALVPARRPKPAAFEQIQPIAEPGSDFRQCLAAHPSGGQLDRKRNAVDQAQNVGDCGNFGRGMCVPVMDPGTSTLPE